MTTKQQTVDATIQGPAGFVAGGVCAGIKPSGRADLAAILCERPATVAAMMTRNRFCGAPVTVNRERVTKSSTARGVIVNSGISNVCTGAEGIEDARKMARLIELSTGSEDESFLVASTGVIGERLPMDKIAMATPQLVASLSASGFGLFARAIMTTDTVPKISRRTVEADDNGPAAVVLGICKGSGMIEPNMATMLAFITTDYPLTPELAKESLAVAVERSLNRVTIDGDTSTSDTTILLSSGMAYEREDASAASDKRFTAALTEVCIDLARAIARDGEGARHLITIDVVGAENEADAHRIAKTVANSPLVKTAIFGRDPNWGRITAAAGRSGVAFDPDAVSLELQGRLIFERGRPRSFPRAELIEALGRDEVDIRLTVGSGPGASRVWTCDMTYDYIKINAEYTT
ncbi:bifunctional glutamate N-acetyltransferase/amino-acid acetyltransferase ArgJ [bacterium]|nr:bifunctional glutamate N-acetyltransferase/amino-acid acetyltransferase ArgJ [bacterium]